MYSRNPTKKGKPIMHETCETVRIESSDPDNQGAFIEINKEDYNEKVHTLYENKGPSTPPPPAGPVYSDAVKALAVEHNVDLTLIEGSGSNGNVVVKDVKAFIETNKVTVNFASEEAGELAAELALDAEKLKDCIGTGKDKAITVEDLEKFVDESE
jgi:2-oxoisovalerate dehydrogenase E2 component (dihydrolipoyl transacylase)